MKRVINTWPYVVCVLALYLGWLVLALAPMPVSPEDRRNLMLLYAGTLAPFAIAAAGAVLGARRGYDWVTVLACVATTVIVGTLSDLFGWHHLPQLDGLGAALVIYAVVGHVGLVAALGVKRLGADPRPGSTR